MDDVWVFAVEGLTDIGDIELLQAFSERPSEKRLISIIEGHLEINLSKVLGGQADYLGESTDNRTLFIVNEMRYTLHQVNLELSKP